MDYENSLLYGLPDTDIQRLHKVHITAARILIRTRKYDHISPILYNLHWLTLKYNIDFKIFKMLALKCLNRLAPPYLSEFLEIAMEIEPLVMLHQSCGMSHQLKSSLHHSQMCLSPSYRLTSFSSNDSCFSVTWMILILVMLL